MPEHAPATSVPLDPYLDWAIKNDFRHHRPGEWLPLFLRFDPRRRDDEPAATTALQRFTRLGWLDEGLKKSVRVPELFLEPPPAIAGSSDFNFCVLFVARKDAAVVTTSAGWRDRVVSMTFGPPFDAPQPALRVPTTRPAPPPDAPRLGFRARVAQCMRGCLARLFGARRAATREVGAVNPFGHPPRSAAPAGRSGSPGSVTQAPSPSSGAGTGAAQPVCVVVLDEGIAFAHERFRSAAGPRIAYLWNQNGMVGTAVGNNTFGTQLTAADIQAEIDKHPAGPDGETAVYRSLAGLDYSVAGSRPLGRRRSHGTHVASIATAITPATPAGERPVIAVELPAQATADPAGSDLYAYIALGLLYALFRTEHNVSGGRRMPIVCNISYGPHHGPHDGTGDFEAFVDQLVESTSNTKWPVSVVLAAGNFRQSRAHALVTVTPRRARTLHWRVQPQDLLPSFVELWCPVEHIGKVTITVASPLGGSMSVSLGKPEDHEDGPNGLVSWLWIKPWNTWSKRVAIVVALQPTATDPPLDATAPTAPSGLWTITVAATAAVTIEAWIGRKIDPGHRRGVARQSYFDDPDYRRVRPNTRPVDFDLTFNRSYARRTATLSGIATGEHTRVVGACVRSSFAPTDYSSMGPVSGGPRVKPSPSLLAVAEDTGALHGVLAAGTRSGSVVAMNGSSVAAPQLTRAVAESLATSTLPVLTPPPAGTPAAVAGDGVLVYPSGWYRTWRPDRPTY